MANTQVRIKDLPPWRAGYVPGAYVALDSQMQITGKVPLEEFRSWMGGGGGVDPSELNKKADKVGTGHNGKMAMLDAYGNLADSGINNSGVQTAVSWAHQHGNQNILSQITAPYRTNDAQKLNGIEDGANKYVHPAFDPFGLGLYKFARDNKGHISAYEAVTAADLDAIPGVEITDTTYEAADGIKLDTSGNKNTFKHTNQVSPGQTGTGTATEGPTVEVPYVKYDANGHITEAGTRTHTVSGFATAAQGNKADSAIQGVKANNTLLTPDSNKVVHITPASIGLDNVDNTSDDEKKSSFTGTVEPMNTGFATGGDVYDAIAEIEKKTLPAFTPAEADKYLKVDSDGNPTWADPYYWEATSTKSGIVKTGDDTVQVVPKNSPSRNKHRTYPVQKNADGQMVVNVPWKDNPVYKGVLVLTIEGTCTDTYSAPTTETSEHVTSMIVSPFYGEGSSFYGNNNTFSVEYHEVPGHPADNRPVFRVDNNNNLLYTFDTEQQDSLAFHCTLSISSKSGYQFIDDTEPVFATWGYDQSMKQPIMDMVRTLVFKKSDVNNMHPILGNGISLTSPRTVDLETTYKIELVAEYLYTSSPSEFFVFDAIDDEGDNMVDNEGNHMIFCEDNPNYTGE